jgi:hypothetical protein
MQSRKWTNHPKFAIETALAGGLALGGAAAWPLVAPAQQSAIGEQFPLSHPPPSLPLLFFVPNRMSLARLDLPDAQPFELTTPSAPLSPRCHLAQPTSLGDGRAFGERGWRRHPADRCRAHAVGAGEMGLHSALSKPLQHLLPLVRHQGLGTAKWLIPRSRKDRGAARTSATKAGTTFLHGAAMPTNNHVRAGDQSQDR